MSRIETAPLVSKRLAIRACNSDDEAKGCVDLQRRIWGFPEEDLVPASLFMVAQQTGGHAFCAFEDENAIGFALSFSGQRDGCRFWHSHMVGVLPDYQNRGVGRLLKLHQREHAICDGVHKIEWTFDPLELRNAHFNIRRLGAIARRYIPNCYGERGSPLHRNLATDRLVAEWYVTSPRVEAALKGAAVSVAPGGLEVSLPVGIDELNSSQIQTDLRGRFTDLLSRGYAVTGYRRGRENCSYILEPYED
jgi:predicted GNAT superfamily acetyltransferase